MLAMSQAVLADIAGLGLQTICDFERGARVPYPETLDTIRIALEVCGIEFLPENGIRFEG